MKQPPCKYCKMPIKATLFDRLRLCTSCEAVIRTLEAAFASIQSPPYSKKSKDYWLTEMNAHFLKLKHEYRKTKQKDSRSIEKTSG